MHYSEKLKLEIEAKEANLKSAEESVIEILKYLNSSKFYEDTTVQVKDVQTRLFYVLDAIRAQ